MPLVLSLLSLSLLPSLARSLVASLRVVGQARKRAVLHAEERGREVRTGCGRVGGYIEGKKTTTGGKREGEREGNDGKKAAEDEGTSGYKLSGNDSIAYRP